MKIDINKDFEEAFPNEVYSGFTLGQCLAAASGLVLSFGAAFLLWRFLKIPIVECTYIAIPLMVPVCAIGFFKYQGQSLIGIIREFLYWRQTEKLVYGAGECRTRTRRPFTTRKMSGKSPGEERKKDRGKRKKYKENRMKKEKKRRSAKKGGQAYGSH